MTRLRLGISTCPNDTFTYHGLLCGAVEVEGVELAIELLDIEELNRGLVAGRFDVAKVSTAAAVHCADRVRCLPVGWAIGYGVGPVVLAGAGPARARPLVLCPGEGTTASLLWRLLNPGFQGTLEQRTFSEILPALERGEADLGVCIHEARFTYQDHGLRLVGDLGERWEARTRAPLPLGGLVADRNLAAPCLAALIRAVQRSLEHARAHPEEALATMRAHAQEGSDEVLWKHVELYVTERTHALGEEGTRALRVFSDQARARGLAPSAAALEVVGADGEPHAH